jgi:hypothetical protein
MEVARYSGFYLSSQPNFVMQQLMITVPGIGSHGGIRIILDWANYLCDHFEVTLLCQTKKQPDWYELDSRVNWAHRIKKTDILIISSPHGISCSRNVKAGKIFLFCQMAEHLFNPSNKAFYKQCVEFYRSPYPMFAISKWNIELFENEFGRKSKTIYIGNGVNLDNFPIIGVDKDFKTVLLESPEPTNQTKDVERVALKVAKRLKAEGYNIIAYGRTPIHKDLDWVVDSYYLNPTIDTLNHLYEWATILVKATIMDARSCSSQEAATKGCVTVRAINFGDDDLVHGDNCIKVPYNEDETELWFHASSLMKDRALHAALAHKALEHVQKYTIDYWMKNFILPELCKES